MIRTDSETASNVGPIVFSGLDPVRVADSSIGRTNVKVPTASLSSADLEKAAVLDQSARGDLGVPRLSSTHPEALGLVLKGEVSPIEPQPDSLDLSFAQRQAHRVRKKELFDANRSDTA